MHPSGGLTWTELISLHKFWSLHVFTQWGIQCKRSMNHQFKQHLIKYTKWLQWRNLSACDSETGAGVKGKEEIMRASLPCSWSQGRKLARLSTIWVSGSWLRLLLPLPLHPSSFTSVTLQLSFQATDPSLLPLLSPLQPLPPLPTPQFLLTGADTCVC